jgi:hypothetical protein
MHNPNFSTFNLQLLFNLKTADARLCLAEQSTIIH